MKAAVDSGRISLLPSFTPYQPTRARTQKLRASGTALVNQRYQEG
jgi:hypothetical protein